MAERGGKGEGPLMDQGEVDALLAALQSGSLPAEPAPAPAWAGGRATVAAVLPYDFRHPQRLSKDRLRALELLHQGFARNAGAALSGQLLTRVELRLDAVSQLTFSEFLLSLPAPTCCVLLQRAGLPGNVVLEVSPAIAFPSIVQLLGRGHSAASIPERPLTETEWSILRTLIDPLVAELRGAWATVRPLDLQVVSQESTPQLLAVYPPNEPMVLLGFTLAVGECSGPLNLCLPHAIIEPMLAELAERGTSAPPRRELAEPVAVTMRQALLQVPIQLAGVLAEMTLTLKNLLELEADDRLETGRGKDAKVTLVADVTPLFRGEWTTTRKHRAIKITERL